MLRFIQFADITVKDTNLKKRFEALWILFDVIKQLSLGRCGKEG